MISKFDPGVRIEEPPPHRSDSLHLAWFPATGIREKFSRPVRKTDSAAAVRRMAIAEKNVFRLPRRLDLITGGAGEGVLSRCAAAILRPGVNQWLNQQASATWP
jgi:hypothetical protein